MFTEQGDGIGWYVQISATGLMVAGGWYSSSPEQVKRYRAAVSEAGPAHELAKLTAVLAKAGMKIDGSRVATRPRGVSADHPNLEWLRYRTLYMARQWEPAAWMASQAPPPRFGTNGGRSRRCSIGSRTSWARATPRQVLAVKTGCGSHRMWPRLVQLVTALRSGAREYGHALAKLICADYPSCCECKRDDLPTEFVPTWVPVGRLL